MKRVIACDLGSNTLRIVQIECTTLVREKEFERIVRTAKDLHVTKCIGEEAQEAIINALHEACALFDFKNISTTCVTTEAMRQANNAEVFLNKLKKMFGLSFEIISGEKEAMYTQLGVESALKRLGYQACEYLLMDLGGGSMELTCKTNTQNFTQSFPLGIVTVAERYKSMDAIKEGVHVELGQLASFLAHLPPYNHLKFVVTAGTPTTVAAFLQGMTYQAYDHQKITGSELTCKAYETALDRLLMMDECARTQWVGVGRSDLIVAGIIIVLEVMRYFGHKKSLVIDDGLREGVAISKCNILEK